MTTLWQGGTNGGANRIFAKDGEVMIAGEGIGGRQELTMKVLAEAFGAIQVKEQMNEARYNADRDPGRMKSFEVKAKNGKSNDKGGDGEADAIVKFGGKGVAGNAAIRFDNKQDADNFKAFLAENRDIYEYVMSGGREKSVEILTSGAKVVKDTFSGFNNIDRAPGQADTDWDGGFTVGNDNAKGTIRLDFGSERADDAAALVEALGTKEGREEFEGLFG